MEFALIAADLEKSFKEVRAVKGISFEVREGEIFGILGPNGAGKSTTLAMITGLVRADRGSIRILGFDIKKNYKEAVENVGVLVENPGFYGHLSAFDNLHLFGRFKGCSPTEIDLILAKVGLEAYSKKKVRTYSQGMRKRLAIANSLLGRPKLLVLDEPTSGLDPRGAKTILDLIESLSAEKKISVVISSNLLDDIEAICDRTLIINEGRAVVCKPVRELVRPDESSYLLRVEPAERALSVITSLPGVKSAERADEGDIRIVLSGLSPAELNRRLVDRGLDVYEMKPVKKTLKELFLQLRN